MNSTTNNAPLTILQARKAAEARLLPVSDSAALDAQVLLCDVLKAEDRAYLFAHPEQLLSAAQQSQYAAVILRRVNGEPVAYIRGFRDWYDRPIHVTPAVLIPRPETELLLEAALEHIRQKPHAIAADVCTGSGAIAVCLKANAPGATVYATDISAAALAVARDNATAAGVQITLLAGDLLAPLQHVGIRLDVLIANPPYIESATLPGLAVSKTEPLLALDGGTDGLDFIRRLLQTARTVCAPQALLLIEHGWNQGEAVLALAKQHLNPAYAEIRKDYAGLDRYLYAIL